MNEEIVPGLTSIIVSTYDCHELLRRITSSCLHNVEKYTDKEDYELILVDNVTEEMGHLLALENRYNRYEINKHIINKKDVGYSASNNQGAKIAKGEYLCFLQNDVFVWEGWLPKLRSFIERGKCDIVWPHQSQTTREFVKESYELPDDIARGNDDAGLTFMTRKGFDKSGGWDERYHGILCEKAFRDKYSAVGLTAWCTSKVLITHISAAVAVVVPDRAEKQYAEESKVMHGK